MSVKLKHSRATHKYYTNLKNTVQGQTLLIPSVTKLKRYETIISDEGETAFTKEPGVNAIKPFFYSKALDNRTARIPD